MTKKIIPLFLMILFCLCPCFASLSDADDASDGFLTTGEYDGSAFSLEYNEQLIVMGGGADSIGARDYSYIEVQYTSTPLSNNSGIYDIVLFDNSELLYLDGITEEITVGNDASAILKGGRVDYITIYHLSSWLSQVTIFCQEGYTKTNSGISGLWADGTAFDIDFIDVGGVFSPYPTANFVNVEIVPEPATLALLVLGGLACRLRENR